MMISLSAGLMSNIPVESLSPRPKDSTVPVLAVKGPPCRFAPWTAPGRFDGPKGSLPALFGSELQRSVGDAQCLDRSLYGG